MTTRGPIVALALLTAACAASSPPTAPRAVAAPADIAVRDTVVWSEGIALAAFVHRARGADKALSTIVLCHGWGGEAAGLRRQATAFAAAGYTAITFDYRGWGQSAGRLVAKSPAAPRRDGQAFTAEVTELRVVVHPWEHVQDIVSVIAWAVAQPEVDAGKLGLWGTSYGGGHVLLVAAYDARVKAVVAQAAAFDSRRAGPQLDAVRAAATRRAKGELPYPPPQARVPGRLHGHAMWEHMQQYAPVEHAALVRPDQAVRIIAAEREELFDNRQHGQRVHERLRGPKDYIVLPGLTHYDVYGKALDQVTTLAIEWYDRHLKEAR
jgi:hypothetical protein